MTLPAWEREGLRTELETRISTTKRSKLFEEYRFFIEQLLSWGTLAKIAEEVVYNDKLTEAEKDDLGDLLNWKDAELRPELREKIGGS